MSNGTWVQTERKAHEAWDKLIQQSPPAARVMHRLVSLMDRRSAVVTSQATLAELVGLHRNTIARALKLLEAQNWIESASVGYAKGGVKVYMVNRRVAWADKRDNQKFATFDARVVLSASEQTAETLLPKPDDLIQLPKESECQMPVGIGIGPPSQPSIDGLEPDLPAVGDGHLQQDLIPPNT